jgi:hypothetical protein
MTWREFPLVNDDLPSEVDIVARLTSLLDIADQLLRLGIDEPFTGWPSHTLSDVCDAIERLHDTLRQGRGARLASSIPLDARLGPAPLRIRRASALGRGHFRIASAVTDMLDGGDRDSVLP